MGVIQPRKGQEDAVLAAFAVLMWRLAILLLGNIAMSTYLLITLWRLPANARIAQVLLRDKK